MEQRGVPRSVSVYRRYAIVSPADPRVEAAKLADGPVHGPVLPTYALQGAGQRSSRTATQGEQDEQDAHGGTSPARVQRSIP